MFISQFLCRVQHFKASPKRVQTALTKVGERDRTSFEYVPFFFDVSAGGSCFFLSIAKCLSFDSPGKGLTAIQLRKFAVENRFLEKELLEKKGELNAEESEKISGLETEILLGLVHSDVADFNELNTDRNAFATRKKMVEDSNCYADSTWVSYSHLQQKIRTNFVVFVLPGKWTGYGRPDDESAFVVSQIDHHLPNTLFIMKSGVHFMSILFLATNNVGNQPRVVGCVPTSEVKKWFDCVVEYWGLPKEWVQSSL